MWWRPKIKKTDFQGGVFAPLGLHKAVKEGRKPCKVYARGCTLCSADFSIAASGRYDITQHIATAKHHSNAERKDSNQPILQFVSSKSNDYDTIRAETLWTLYVVEHNMPFNEVKEACLCMFLKNTGFYWKIQVCGLQNTGLYFQRLACLCITTSI